MMGQMCEQKATHQELKDLCHEMVKMQTAEIAQMKQWLKDWYGIEYQAQVRPDAMKEMEELSKLSGAAFEVMFMKMLIKHHAEAIMMSAECLHMSYHKELDQLCIKMIQSQVEEVKKLKQWLCDWYQICEGQNRMDEAPMEMTANGKSNGPFTLSFVAKEDGEYEVQARTNLARGDWIPFTNIVGASGIKTIEDDETAGGKFYRLKGEK